MARSKKPASTPEVVVTDRRTSNAADRRKNARRTKQLGVDEDLRDGQERRFRPDRRRNIDPTTCERDYTTDELEFMRAMDDYKRQSGRPFPTWSEVLEVLRDLGYCKVESQEPTPVA